MVNIYTYTIIIIIYIISFPPVYNVAKVYTSIYKCRSCLYTGTEIGHHSAWQDMHFW